MIFLTKKEQEKEQEGERTGKNRTPINLLNKKWVSFYSFYSKKWVSFYSLLFCVLSTLSKNRMPKNRTPIARIRSKDRTPIIFSKNRTPINLNQKMGVLLFFYYFFLLFSIFFIYSLSSFYPLFILFLSSFYPSFRQWQCYQRLPNQGIGKKRRGYP